MTDLERIQAALREQQLDGWLLLDFRGRNPLAQRILQIPPGGHSTRRYACAIPAEGEPRKLVHRIESGQLDHLPGAKHVYLSWQEYESGLAELVAGMQQLALEYSPQGRNPYISLVDAGTVELLRSFDLQLVSSGDLVQQFESALNREQQISHHRAAIHTDEAFTLAWRKIIAATSGGGTIDETEVQQAILDHFAACSMITDHPPIVARAAHSGNPHYETGTGDDTAIRQGDLVLIDLWARFDHDNGVYSDLTRMGFVGTEVPDRYAEVFHVVAAARDAAIALLRKSAEAGEPLEGWQVDRAARTVIEQAGYADNFVHRTGHSIGQETHGNGAHMDDLEIHEDRRILPGACFSIEPGIYLDDFGIRSEVNICIGDDGTVEVTGGPVQQAILPILSEAAGT